MGVTSSSEPKSEDELGQEEEPTRPPAPRTTRTHLICLSRSHNKFAIALYQEVARDGKRPGNVVMSPLGLGIGLGMAYLGTDGQTQEEMYDALHLNEVQEPQLLPAYAAMHWDILRSTTPKGCRCEPAIRLFAQMEYKLTNEYEEVLTNYEISRIRHVDFKDRPDLARKEINKWVEDRTHGRIKDVLPLGYIDNETKLFLICAMYLKPFWYHPFDPKKTCKMAFYLPMKEIIEVNMMNQQNIFRVGTLQKLDCDVIEMPFSNEHMRIYIFLPKKNDGLQKIESKLTRTLVEALEDHIFEEYVDVFLPKFTWIHGSSCGEFLQRIGIKDLFREGKADLSGINGSNELYMNRIYHYMHMDLDETGSDSDPASVHDVGTTSDAKPKRIFKADHPFVFYIRDDRSRAVVLIGRVVRPQLLS